MASRLNPYLSFENNAREAMEFYQSVLGGELIVNTFGEYGDELRGCWERLSHGASITMPLEMQMWGDELGMLTDRFGMQWMVSIAGSRD